MTQEQKELLLKDLCSRLPYGVKVYDIKSDINSSFMNLNHINGTVKEVFISYMHKCRTAPIEDVKPYLFPLSSMTEEQKADCPIGETNLNIIISNIGCYGIIEIPWRLSYLFVDWCNKNHFDYRGLIPLGLAEDATGKNIYKL